MSVTPVDPWPATIAQSEWCERLGIARQAVESAGAALLRLPRVGRAEERGDQLKTAADQAAEGWVSAYLRAFYPDDRLLAEEEFEAVGERWDAPPSYWTIDALDGTRSFVDGFAGFCVQVAYVEAGAVRLGVVYEPVEDCTYYATLGAGSYRQTGDEPAQRLEASCWGNPARPPGPAPRFVDSTRPRELAGRWFEEHHATFVELGSIGLKICRVADGRADIFLKALRFKLWDVAPGAVILTEAGGRLGLWDGTPVPFAAPQVHHRDILATHADRFDEVVQDIQGYEPGQQDRLVT